jgi:hypothetical protein
MQPASRTGAAGESIGPSARMEGGSHDDSAIFTAFVKVSLENVKIVKCLPQL